MVENITRMSDTELIANCIKGNSECFNILLGRYKNLVYSVILRMVNDYEETNDLAQDVFLKIYVNLDKYCPDYKFSTWVIRIATNHVIDYRRKKHIESVSLDEIEYDGVVYDTPEEQLINQEQSAELDRLVDDLPEIYKIPIVLYHKNGLSYSEIANAIKEPLSKIKNRIFRGRKILKENMSND